jgi:hypothetical protein
LLIILIIGISTQKQTPTIPTPVKNIEYYTKYYVSYWFDYYKINGMVDPLTGYVVTKQGIEKQIYKIVKWESGFKPISKSWEKTTHCYSYGLMRLLPSTAKDMGWEFDNNDELYNVKNNLKYGIKYYCKQIKRYNGSMKKAVAAYNAGGAYYTKCGSKYINMVYHADDVKLYTMAKID